ncbi:hypothetical protein [Rhizobium sp. Rhizsp42]
MKAVDIMNLPRASVSELLQDLEAHLCGCWRTSLT